ncbi:hypothetical protein [Pseudomonas laurylsulfatiphila]|uniref:hypothetical protein n=1 Tax=Pseudomonas laurylsulfatiphila TaxID=2011015 RepID=UPI003D20BCE1
MHEESALLEFNCCNCKLLLSENLLSNISRGEKWFRQTLQSDQVYLSKLFNLKHSVEGHNHIPYAHFQNGGIAYFCLLTCQDCNSANIAVIEFYEMQPARYIAKLQGLAVCDETNKNN